MKPSHAVVLLLVCLSAGCIASTPDDPPTILLPHARPSLEAFGADPGPADMLEARCGSLDCHGQAGRPLRIYGQSGLRLDPNDSPGGRPRTEAETLATYISVIGVEPEQMGAVASERGAEPTRLMLVRKAIGTERHKGGRVFTDESDPAYACLIAWLRGDPVTRLCAP